MAVFDLLSEELRVAVTKAGIDEPTPPQREAVPIILAGENVLLIAPTGTGKTESVLLPVLHNFLKNRREPKRGISILYITPLRALNRDMLRRLEFWSRQLGFTVEVRHGDTPQSERRRQTIKPPDLLVTTPETLQAMLPARRMRRNLSEVRWVIVDEIHNLAGSKRGAQLTVGLERLRSLTRRNYQILGLSATVSSPNDVSRFLSGVGQRMAIVEIPLNKKVHYTIEFPYPSEDDHAIAQSLFTSPEAAARLSLISELIGTHTSTLVFVNSRSVAEMLGSKLAALKTNVAVHHGSLPREERERTEGKFKAGTIKALVCTSTLELGIDIGSVDLTIQYMSPRQVTSLIQRVGRSGHRLSDESRGCIIAVSPDDVLESAAAIDQAKNSFLEPLKIYQNPLDVMAHQIAGVILDNDGEISRKTVLELLRRTRVYEKLEEKVFSRVVSFMQQLNLLREERNVLRATRRTRLYYYENLSMIPDERRYLVIDLTTNQSVGILGEEFILLHAKVGLHFICKGKIWEIKSVSDDYRVYVTPVEDPLAAIPGWDGEMLPVPIGLAQKVGSTRRVIEQLLRDSTIPKVVEALKIRADRFAKRKVVEEISEHLKMYAPLPTDKRILAEFFDRYLIIHGCFGEAVNRTLGFIFEEVLSKENLIRSWWADGYRILFELTIDRSEPRLEDTVTKLFGQDDISLQAILNLRLSKQFPFPEEVKNIAQRFGVLKRGQYLAHGGLCALPTRLGNTPVFEEAMAEIERTRLDLPHVLEIFRNIRAGSLKVEIFHAADKPTPIGYHILNRYVDVPELIAPDNEIKDGLQRMRIALENVWVDLVCFECGDRQPRTVIKDFGPKPRCRTCGSGLLGISRSQLLVESLGRKLKGEKLSDSEKQILSRGRRMADLVLSYGKKAILAMLVYGIGPQTAAKILAEMHEDDESFFGALLDAKLKFIVTRPYWDRG